MSAWPEWQLQGNGAPQLFSRSTAETFISQPTWLCLSLQDVRLLLDSLSGLLQHLQQLQLQEQQWQHKAESLGCPLRQLEAQAAAIKGVGFVHRP